MSYRRVARKAIRYTEATRLDQPKPVQTTEAALESLSYRDIQARAVVLGINGKQKRDDLIKAIQEAESA